MNEIPNHVPDQPCAERLAIITDVVPPLGITTEFPLIGGTKNILAGILRQNNIKLESCFVGALCRQAIDMPSFLRNTTLFKSQTDRLLADLEDYQPRIVITLGKEASSFMKGENVAIVDERGYPFVSPKLKALCLATFHPAMTFKVYKWTHLLRFDLHKAVRLAQDHPYQPINREVRTIADPKELDDYLRSCCSSERLTAWDVETFDNPQGKYITMMSFSNQPTLGIVVPFVGQGGHYMSFEQECAIWRVLAYWLPRLKLVGHNAVHYDHYVTSLWHRIEPNVIEDTMLAHWECFCEMQKSLGFLGSLYTDNPAWKHLRKSSARNPFQTQLTYSGLDACGTKEIAAGVLTELKEEPPSVQAHYNFNLRLSKAVQFMAIGGILIDREKHEERLKSLGAEAELLQAKLDAEVGHHLNVRSTKQKKEYLYDKLRLPRSYKPVKDEYGDVESRETTDYLTLLRLRLEFPEIKTLHLILQLTKLLKRISNLSFSLSKAGRVHAIYNVVGTETGRVSCYKGHDYYGLQLQTVAEADRDLFLPSPGFKWLKADLEGADNWTVACFSAYLGDPTMLEDLKAGIKPAQMIGIMEAYGKDSQSWDYDKLRAEAKKLKARQPERYAVHKAVTHGSSYAMKAQRMSEVVLIKSKGDIVVDPTDCANLQELFFTRYPGVRAYQRHIDRVLADQGRLIAPSGVCRYFLDRVTNAETLRQAYAHLPQAVTTYVTNRTVLGLYESGKNRRRFLAGQPEVGNGQMATLAGGKHACKEAALTTSHPTKNTPLKSKNFSSLILAPVHQMHDELDAQFRPEDREEAAQILWEVARQPVEIMGIEVEIPWEAGYGDTWKEAKEPF